MHMAKPCVTVTAVQSLQLFLILRPRSILRPVVPCVYMYTTFSGAAVIVIAYKL